MQKLSHLGFFAYPLTLKYNKIKLKKKTVNNPDLKMSMSRPGCYLMLCKHVGDDFIFPEAEYRKYQVMPETKLGTVEVAASVVLPKSQLSGKCI